MATFSNGICQPVQESLNNVALNSAPVLQRGQTGFFDAITSDINKGGMRTISVSTVNGGTRQVELLFTQPRTVSEVGATPTSACVSGVEPAPQAQLISVDGYREIKWTMSRAEVSRICYETQDEYRTELLWGAMNALIEAVNLDCQVRALQLFGNSYQTGVPPYTYIPPVAPIPAPIIKSGDFSANYQGWSNVVKDSLRRIRINGTPIVVGAGANGIALYNDIMEYGCCNNEGINLGTAKMGQMYYFYDQFTDDNWGANGFTVFAPGAFQFIQHNNFSPFLEVAENGRIVRKPNPNNVPWNGVYEHNSVMDPFTNTEFDVQVEFNHCSLGREFTFIMSTNYTLWAPPSNGFQNTDRMFGTRRSLLFEATLA